MIVAHEVTNVGHDREQLSPMSHQTRDAIDEQDLTVLADRGYYKGQQIYDCEQAGIKTLVPKPQTSGNKAAGLFDKADFRYIPSKDEYQCPAGQRANPFRPVVTGSYRVARITCARAGRVRFHRRQSDEDPIPTARRLSKAVMSTRAPKGNQLCLVRRMIQYQRYSSILTASTMLM